MLYNMELPSDRAMSEKRLAQLLLNPLIVCVCVLLLLWAAGSHSGQGGALHRGTTSNRCGESCFPLASLSLLCALLSSLFLDVACVAVVRFFGCLFSLLLFGAREHVWVMTIQSDQRSTPSNVPEAHNQNLYDKGEQSLTYAARAPRR